MAWGTRGTIWVGDLVYKFNYKDEAKKQEAIGRRDEWQVELRTLRRFAGFVWVISKRESARTTRVLVINAFNGDVLEEHLSEWIE